MKPLQDFINVITDTNSTIDDAIKTASVLISDESWGESQCNEIISKLVPFISPEHYTRAPFIATICGSFVERGGNSEIIAKPVLDMLELILEDAYKFAEACYEDEFSDAIMAKVSQEFPEQAKAWNAFATHWPPCVVVLSDSAERREQYQHLHEKVDLIGDFHEGGYWLSRLLMVLDDEPLLVIEPHSQKGFFAKISGISDNFQLHTLLMDALIGDPQQGWLQGTPLAPEIAAVVRGDGPPEIDEEITGNWNLYTCKALQPDFSLSLEDEEAYCIPGEGVPIDIPCFADYRVILLGPVVHESNWPANRMFERLQSNIEVDRKMTSQEVTDWLTKIAADNQ